jgi:DNA topoisomerase III
MRRILCVAEKPSIAKAVATHLAGTLQTVSKKQSMLCGVALWKANLEQHNTRNQYIKNYVFTYRFEAWGQCNVTFTSVIGHIIANDFEGRFRKWGGCEPRDLFDAPIVSSVDSVRNLLTL